MEHHGFVDAVEELRPEGLLPRADDVVELVDEEHDARASDLERYKSKY
ncbi:MAG: hypothetical protein ACRD3V_26680 [Vicinamibacteria bacterium]